jgi:hypothetical protein
MMMTKMDLLAMTTAPRPTTTTAETTKLATKSSAREAMQTSTKNSQTTTPNMNTLASIPRTMTTSETNLRKSAHPERC